MCGFGLGWLLMKRKKFSVEKMPGICEGGVSRDRVREDVRVILIDGKFGRIRLF